MKLNTEKKASPAQIKAIHAILNKHGMLDQKAEYISELTHGRTKSTKDLTHAEVKEFFTLFANAEDVINKKRTAIYSAIYKIAWILKIIYGDTQDDYKMNVVKLNKFCRERGTVKKNLTEMSLFELNKTHRQFEAMLKKLNNK